MHHNPEHGGCDRTATHVGFLCVQVEPDTGGAPALFSFGVKSRGLSSITHPTEGMLGPESHVPGVCPRAGFGQPQANQLVSAQGWAGRALQRAQAAHGYHWAKNQFAVYAMLCVMLSRAAPQVAAQPKCTPGESHSGLNRKNYNKILVGCHSQTMQS